jgi:hypothetical protein
MQRPALQIGVLPAFPELLPPGLVLSPDLPVSARIGASNTNFAMLAGGGLDVRLGRHVYFRPFEASYFLMRVPSFLTNGSHFQSEQFPLLGRNQLHVWWTEIGDPQSGSGFALKVIRRRFSQFAPRKRGCMPCY